jgi:hypothetical protein
MGFVSAHGFPADINIYPTGEMLSVLSNGEKEKIVIIVTGHGNQNGICADNDINLALPNLLCKTTLETREIIAVS